MTQTRRNIAAGILLALMVAHAYGGHHPHPGHGGFHVLFTTSSAQPLTQDQTNELSATKVLDYLDAHCSKEDGHAGWRHYDVSMTPADLENESKYWQELWPKHQGPPSVLIDNGKLISTPLPADSDHLLDLLQKYGGK